VRIVGGNLTVADANTGSWLINVEQVFTGTTLTHVGTKYMGASADISHAVTTSSPADSSFAKTAKILTKVGAGRATSHLDTAAKALKLGEDIVGGAAKVGQYLWKTLGGWGGVVKGASAAAAMFGL